MATGYDDLIPVKAALGSGYDDLIPSQSSGMPGPRQRPGALTQLGRSAASLADVTVGGVIPAVVQQVGYGLARLNRSPEQAQAATARLVGAVESPFGRAFGVTETPEYQQEAGRQLIDFIGQNFQKGAKWIAGKTGLPQSDVENYMGTASVAAPAVARPVARTVQQAAAPVIEKAVIGAKMPFEGRAQAKRERLSQEDYARGPQIDAAADAQRLGIVLNPTDIQSTVGTRLTAMAAGPRAPEALANANKNQVRTVALGDMDLPPTTQLNSPKAFQQARTQVAAPYEQVKKLPIQQADDAMVQRLEALRADLDVIGAKEYAPAISKIVDDAIAKTQTGLTGEQLLKNISVLRERARKTYNNKSATTEALDVADTNLKVATELESMIDNSIFNPKLLSEFRDARQKMARTYAYEGATDLNTGMVDVGKLARITSKDNALTGDIASLGKIAGNFPDVFSAQPTPGFFSAPRLSRSGPAGAGGALIGSQFGLTGSILGGALGGALGDVGGALAARRLASPSYQAGLTLRDARIPVNQLAASMQPIPQSQAIVPYQAPVEVLGQGQGTYFPNFEMRGEGRAANRVVWDPATKTYRAEFAPEVTPMAPEAPLNRLAYDPNAPVQGQPNAFNIMRQRERDLSMRQGMAAEQQAAAAEAASRQPTRGAVELAFDAAGNLIEAPTAGAGGGIGAVSSLDSAVAKIAGQMQAGTSTKFSTRKTTEGKVVKTEDPFGGVLPGEAVISRTGPKFKTTGKTTIGESTREPSLFNLSAEEKIAWNKAKADIAEVAPGFKALSDKAVAEKMMDRQWLQDAIVKAEQKAKLQDQIIARANNERARQAAMIEREKLTDALETLEEQFRKARPVSTGGQGPKTRAFQRNMLTPEQEIQNALSR
jgi:hypothetical protein